MKSEAPAEAKYHVDESIRSIRAWSKIQSSYLKLFFFFGFVVLYLVIVTMQLNIGNSWAIAAGLQQVFLGTLSNVLLQDDFWNFLLTPGTGLMSVVFTSGWYNGQNFTADQQGYILNFNKLVGGLLIVQQRGDVSQDGCVGLFGPSSYSLYYTNCYLDTLITTPRNITDPNILAMNPNPFVYENTQYFGYAAFFGVAASSSQNIALAQLLQNNLWTDKQTRSIEIKFAIYNGNLNVFSFVTMSFAFDKAGIFLNGNLMQSQSISMEPYRAPTDIIRLVLEIIFMVMVSFQIWGLLATVAMAIKDRNWKEVFNLWTIIDAGNLACLALFIILRVIALNMIYNNPITVPTNIYQTILEEVASIQNVQQLVIFINVMLSLIRLHKYYQFQPRLAVLNNTLGHAFTDLYHFVIMFAVIFGGFSVMGHFLFGLSLQDYCSMGISMQTLFQGLLGNFNYVEVNVASPEMGAIFFVAFTFVGNLVLINVLFAILIDAYATTAEKNSTAASVAEDLGIAVLKTFNAIKRSPLSDRVVIQALQNAKEKGLEHLSPTELAAMIVPDQVFNESAPFNYPGLVQKIHKEEEKEDDILEALKDVLKENEGLRRRLRNAGEDVPRLPVAKRV